MDIVTVLLVFVVVGLVMWLINTYIPMAEGIKTLMNVAVIVILVFWLLQAFGLLSSLSSVKLPHFGKS